VFCGRSTRMMAKTSLVTLLIILVRYTSASHARASGELWATARREELSEVVRRVVGEGAHRAAVDNAADARTVHSCLIPAHASAAGEHRGKDGP
jgi:hypothetical protein